jgi:hypothetical protein
VVSLSQKRLEQGIEFEKEEERRKSKSVQALVESSAFPSFGQG